MPAPLAARYPALPGDASWTALLADTSSDLGGLERWRVEVQQTPPRHAASLRLVVQAYRRGELIEGRPGPYARPIASAQRLVHSEDLLEGVVVDLMHFGDVASEEGDSVVVAWTEPAHTELDFDGLEARPGNQALAHVRALPPRSAFRA